MTTYIHLWNALCMGPWCWEVCLCPTIRHKAGDWAPAATDGAGDGYSLNFFIYFLTFIVTTYINISSYNILDTICGTIHSVHTSMTASTTLRYRFLNTALKF